MFFLLTTTAHPHNPTERQWAFHLGQSALYVVPVGGLNATSCPRWFTKFEAWATGDHVKTHHGTLRKPDICLDDFFDMARKSSLNAGQGTDSILWQPLCVRRSLNTTSSFPFLTISGGTGGKWYGLMQDAIWVRCPSQESTSSYSNSIAI